MSFKRRPDKNKVLVKYETLDVKHKEKVNQFFNKRKNLTLLKEQFNELIEKKKITKNQNDIYEINNKLDNLENEIKDVENNTSELNYYSNTYDILFNYYEDKNGNNGGEDIISSIVEIKSEKKTKTFIQNKKQSNMENVLNIIDYINSLNEKKQEEKKIEKKPEKLSKLDLYEKYMNIIETKGGNKNIQFQTKCEKCHSNKILVQNEGFYVCPICGIIENIIIESDIPNYKEPVQEKQCFVYKRKNHLNEWLNQFQAKETTIIPNEIYEKIIKEIRKIRIKDLSMVNFNTMKNILKHLKLQQYYEHNIYILCKITNKTPPTITRETEQKIRKMFDEIQVPFNKYKPKNRTNFLSYSYVLHKFFQILDLNELLEYLPLLKSREKLRLQDKIWKNICVDLDWKYYESI